MELEVSKIVKGCRQLLGDEVEPSSLTDVCLLPYMLSKYRH